MPIYALTIQITALPEDVEPLRSRHLDHLRGLQRAGRLRLAGEFPHGDGSVEVFEAADRKQAEATARAHPLVEAGLAAWTVRELTPFPRDATDG